VNPNLADLFCFQFCFFFAFRRLRLAIRSSGGVCHKLVHLLASKYCTHHLRLGSKDVDNGRTSRGIIFDVRIAVSSSFVVTLGHLTTDANGILIVWNDGRSFIASFR
jgi:hypothetical protein